MTGGGGGGSLRREPPHRMPPSNVYRGTTPPGVSPGHYQVPVSATPVGAGGGIPLRPRPPPVIPKSMEQSTHVPFYGGRSDSTPVRHDTPPSFVANPNSNPSVTLPPGSRHQRVSDDSQYGFLPSSLKKSGKGNASKKHIEFDLDPRESSQQQQQLLSEVGGTEEEVN